MGVPNSLTPPNSSLTIPGFGPYIASQLIARIGNPHRFAGRKQLIRLAGYDLNAKRSGKTSDTAVPVISKRGNGDLRYALYQAALIASYHDHGFRALYTRYLTPQGLKNIHVLLYF
jgi:transposase